MKAERTVTWRDSWRFYLVAAAMLVLAGVLVWRLVVLQVLPTGERDYTFLQRQGNARILRTVTIPAYRGMITDRHGRPLAVSTPVESLWADPQVLQAHRARWAELADALDMPAAQLARRLTRHSGRRFLYLRRQMQPREARAVLALGIPGVHSRAEYRRFYPTGEVTAHLLGVTNVDDRGQEGLELAFDDWLRGESGARQVMKNRHGEIVKAIRQVKPVAPGKDLQLTLDLRLQYMAYRELKAAVTRAGAQSGSFILLDSRTGEVLAMANQPSYNPNDRSRLEPANLRNRALTDVLEPGSTVKPFTMAAALESGTYTPDSVVDTHPGHIRVANKTFLDPVNYGELDLTHILTKSSQVGTTKVALSLDPMAIRDVFARLGLGQATGAGFPGEGSGYLPDHARWSDIERATFAFGYGLSVTPLQLARAYAVLANDGIKPPISLVRGATTPAPERVLEASVARQVVDMLATVTRPGGTATRAAISGYSVAGKTGTVHQVGARGYADHRYVAVFAGMVPASDPRLVAVVVINEPQGDRYFGGLVAAPVFADVMEGALRLMALPPDADGGGKEAIALASSTDGVTQ